MTEQNPKPIVVAVGHDPIDAAWRFAAGEAERPGCGLHLVHVVHLIAQGPEMVLVAETDLERAGRQALNAAVNGPATWCRRRAGDQRGSRRRGGPDLGRDRRGRPDDRPRASRPLEHDARGDPIGLQRRRRPRPSARRLRAVALVADADAWWLPDSHGRRRRPRAVRGGAERRGRRGQEPGRDPARPPHLELPERLRRHHPDPDRDEEWTERAAAEIQQRSTRWETTGRSRCRSRLVTPTRPTPSSRPAGRRTCW